MDLERARETLTKHARSARNGVFPRETNFSGQLTNPICGDHVQLRGIINQNVIAEIGFLAKACAICTASASLLCEEIEGRDIEAALAYGRLFEEAVLESPGTVWPRDLEGLLSFAHLRENPSRRACALLSHVVLRSALSAHVGS